MRRWAGSLSGMHIEAVTPETPEERLRQWHAVEVAIADSEEWPLPAMTLDELRGHARHPGGEPISRYAAHLAIEDENVVGFNHEWWIAADNSHLVDVSVHVHPEHRRRGIGRTLFDDVVKRASEDGRRALMIGAPQTSPGAAFLEAVGAPIELEDRHSLLDLAVVDWGRVATGAEPATGYRLVSWLTRPPEDILPSLAVAVASMDDAPKGGLDLVRETWRPDMLIASYALSEAREYGRFGVAAVHEASGEVAGYTDLHVTPGRIDYAEQQDTVIIPAHRGHRLGMAIKCQMLLNLKQWAPELRTISTWNADSNTHMLAVNIELGFEKAELWGMHQLSLR